METTQTTMTRATLARILADERGRFLAFVVRHTRDAAVAEEVLHDAITVALARVDQLDDATRWQGWLFRIVRNTLIDRGRRMQREKKLATHLPHEPSMQGDDAPARSPCTCVLTVAESLKPEYRAVLEAVELGDASLKDWAVDNQVTANNAAVRLHRARAALRSGLLKTCGACADDGCMDCDCVATTSPPAPLPKGEGCQKRPIST